MPSRATKYTPFFMVYGFEAMLPIDLKFGSPRLKAYNEQTNKETRENTVDQLEEARDMALLNSARYQQKVRRYHDKHMRKRDLNAGDLVLHRRQSNQGRHKLTPPWEGPYILAEVLKPRTYKLADEKGTVSPTHGTSNNYVASTLRASRLYVFMHILYQDPVNEYLNK